MKEAQIRRMVERQRRYFSRHPFPSVVDRRADLRRLERMVVRHEGEISEALLADLGKSATESYMSETGMVLSEIRWMIRHVGELTRAHVVPTPMAQSVARSVVSPTPLGVVLIMSPWNYPVLLTLEPLADALAAGNTVVLKPSAYSPHVSALLGRLLPQYFPREKVCVVTGGREENQSLLDQHFDLIFFTGSLQVGRVVMQKAAEHLTPVVLELGGKSPCIVDETARIDLAARRIVFGKLLNCGQTCVAPDYILVQEDVAPALVEALGREITRQYGTEPLTNPDYGKIISRKHFERVSSLISGHVVLGGQTDPEHLRIAPTILYPASWEDPAMGQEIFGPVLPILTFRDIREVPALLRERAQPLALYIFSEDRRSVRCVLNRVRFGGGCVNDCIIHLATSAMGFGGVGESGMGSYHGRDGFAAFSHSRSIVDRKTWLDLPMRYQPYTRLNDRLIRLFMR